MNVLLHQLHVTGKTGLALAENDLKLLLLGRFDHLVEVRPQAVGAGIILVAVDVVDMLAEATTTEISKQKAPATLSENIDVARAGGKVAGDARKAIETQTGVPVITSKNAAQLSEVVTNLLEDAADMDK